MKVLQINSVCGIGSTGRIATDLHSILKEQGHESYIAYGRGEAKNCDAAIKIGNKLDNYMHVAQTRLLDRHGLGSYYATKRFIKKIEDINPDIIHLHNIHGYYINIQVLFKCLKKMNKPIIWTLHDCWAFTGHCSHFDYIGCEKWQEECIKCQQKKEYPSSLGWDRAKKNYKLKKELFSGLNNMTIVTPSEWLAHLVRKSFLKQYDIKVINNGIDLEAFKKNEDGFRQKQKLHNKFIILGVASVWNKRKGLEYFIEMAKQLKHDEVIILVGVTEAQQKKLPKEIIGITRTNNVKELAAIYSAADVFVNPTLEDNFPTTNLEALACGTPVVTFNTGGSAESIDESSGKVIKEKSVQKILQNIRDLKSNKIPSENCIHRSKLYDKHERYNEYIEVYKNAKEGDSYAGTILN